VAVSKHWEKGGEGAVELAETVVEACKAEPKLHFLYEETTPLKERIELIAKEVYGADGVSFGPAAEDKIKAAEKDPAMHKLGTCMVKTHLSLSHDPTLKGRPKGWVLPVRDVQAFMGAGFFVPIAGDIKLMPGMASDPAFRYVDVDVNTGKVKGLF
jgi:formate--tetrahydrofolate ligase